MDVGYGETLARANSHAHGSQQIWTEAGFATAILNFLFNIVSLALVKVG